MVHHSFSESLRRVIRQARDAGVPLDNIAGELEENLEALNIELSMLEADEPDGDTS